MLNAKEYQLTMFNKRAFPLDVVTQVMDHSDSKWTFLFNVNLKNFLKIQEGIQLFIYKRKYNI